MAEVKLSDLSSDFITPSLACVQPMQIDRAKPNRVLKLEGLQPLKPFMAFCKMGFPTHSYTASFVIPGAKT